MIRAQILKSEQVVEPQILILKLWFCGPKRVA